MLKSKNLHRLFKGNQIKSIDANDLEMWEDHCDKERELIGQTVSDSLWVHNETKDSPLLRYEKTHLIHL